MLFKCCIVSNCLLAFIVIAGDTENSLDEKADQLAHLYEQGNAYMNLIRNKEPWEIPGAVTTCIESDTKCMDGTCYRKIDLCDGYNDCVNGYDENPAVCENAFDITKFSCLNGLLINITQLCDGIKDCNDGSDEDDTICHVESAEICALPESQTLRLQCEFKGVPEPCQLRIRPWTNARIFCNVGYIPRKKTKWIDVNKCRDSGKWIHKMPNCTFDCGMTLKDNYPWNVVLYGLTPGGYEGRCLGTVITPFDILSDGKCNFKKYVNNELKHEIKIASFGTPMFVCHDEVQTYGLLGVNYMVTPYGGKYHYVLNQFTLPNQEDLGKNKSKSGKNETYSHYNNTFLFEMAIFEVSHLDVTKYRPACFDVDNKLEINSSMIGKVVMKFNKLSPIYKVVDLEILTYNDCQKYLERRFEDYVSNLSYGDFCALYNGCEPRCSIYEDPEFPEILTGTGITVNVSGKFYLLGGYRQNLTFRNERGENIFAVYIFSDVRLWGKNNKAISQIVDVDKYHLTRWSAFLPTESCLSPYSYGAVYTTSPCVIKNESCSSEILSHQMMAEYSTIFMHCKENFTLKGDCNYKICEDGKWLPEDNTCVRLCEPLESIPSVKTRCFYENDNVSCVEKVMAETVATSVCEAGGLIKDVTTYNNTCLHSGNWRDSPEVIQIICIDLCGILKSEKTLIQDGEEANATYHPWNTGLYYEYEPENYIHICGGTLISKFAVLSAAHCVQDVNHVRLSAEELKIGLGKLYRNFSHPLDLHAQLIEVSSVYVPNLYDGPPSAHVADIAIFELKLAADLNEFVVPACIDTSNQFTVNSNSLGSVVGWGLNGTAENAQQTDTLMKAELPYMDRELCIKTSKKEFNVTLRITIDKFCAFHITGGKSTVRRGDSGSGITFKFEGRHYIYGLVSLQSSNATSMFTNITYPEHLNFINSVLNQISSNKKNFISSR